MIESGTDKQKRFELLVKTAISQYQRLSQHVADPPSEEGLKGLE